MNDMTTTTTEVALVLPAKDRLSVIFKEAGDPLERTVQSLEQAARKEAALLDPSTEEGRDALKSLAYKISQSKAELDRQGKALTEEQRKEVAAVNASRKVFDERLAALRDEIRKPATEWEQREKDRIAKHETGLTVFALDRADLSSSIEHIAHVIEEIETAPAGEDQWQEYADAAERMRADALTKYYALYNELCDRAKEQAELEELRAAQRAREEAEAAEIKRKADAADLETRATELRQLIRKLSRGPEDSEGISPAGALRAWDDSVNQLERINIGQSAWGPHAAMLGEAVSDALERATDKRDLAQKVRDAEIEAERTAAAEKAAQEATQKAEADKVAAEKRHADELAAVKAKAEADAQAERDRVAAERQAELDRAEKQRQDEAAARVAREADDSHKAEIFDQIFHGLCPFCQDADVALAVTSALMAGKIPHVEVKL